MSRAVVGWLLASLLLATCLAAMTPTPYNRHPRPKKLDTSRIVTQSTCGRISTTPISEQLVGGGGCIACNNSETCCDGSSCCNSGQFCCEANNTCCQDTCCKTDNEQCCSDPTNGGVCCESEWSFCCVPQPEYDLPSRCCPRWFVCCNLGEYGCCNPDTGLPLVSSDVHEQPAVRNIDEQKPALRSMPRNAYALVLEPTWIGNMNFDVMSINVTTGAALNVTKVQSFKTGGEEQRQFMFDKKLNVFYLLQADNDDDGHTPLEAPIRLFTIQPVSGSATACTVTGGAFNEVTGYRLLPGTGTIVFATYWLERSSGSAPSNSNSNAASESSSSGSPLPEKAGYKFYHLDVPSCAATLVAQSTNPITPQFVDNYAGWFHDVSPDGSIVYRLGYEDVMSSSNFGIGATVIVPSSSSSGVYSNATPVWKTIPRPDGTHEGYITLNLFAPSSVPTLSPTATSPFDAWFVSMAPTNNLTQQGDLSLFMWSPLDPVQNVSLLATFPNAHQYPALSFGPLSESLSLDCSRYAALVVKDSSFGSSYDTLAVVLVDGIKPPGQGTRPSVVLEAQLEPGLLAETVSPAGIGLPESS